MPLDRVRPFLTGSPEIYETSFPSGLDTLDTNAEVTITLAISQRPQSVSHSEKQQLDSLSIEDEWVECLPSNYWTAIDIRRHGHEQAKFASFLPYTRGILTPGSDTEPPRPLGCMVFKIFPQKYHVSAAVTYSASRAEARRLEKERRVTTILKDLSIQRQEGADDEKEEKEGDWVFVT